MLHKNASGEPSGLITNIQKYTIHDGPGIRTAVFFKGCPLRCEWCSNPETIEPYPQVGVYPGKCLSRTKCGACVRVCPAGGAPITFDEGGVLRSVQRVSTCEGCTACTNVCPGRALKLWGEYKTVPELLRIITEDRSFYQKTGGGVTLNGGDALLQWEFSALLLRACKEASIGTCLESELYCAPEHLEAVLPYTDLIIADIKQMDSDKHKAYTGVPNEPILDNLRHLAQRDVPLVIRTPVIPGYNNDSAHMRRVGAFLRDGLGGKIVQIQLLPYRRLGTEKYDSLGLPYPFTVPETQGRAERDQNLQELADLLRRDFDLRAEVDSAAKLKV